MKGESDLKVGQAPKQHNFNVPARALIACMLGV